MNLCLSGVAGCFADTQYPRVVEEAIGVVTARKPDAVTFNEACSGDIARIAEETGYHTRFATVRHRGRPLRCVNPGRRGVFGNAVITKGAIDSSVDQAFDAQVGREERRWICVETVRGVDICTTHLSTRGSQAARATSDDQCDEFTAVLATRDQHGPVIAAGDINRLDSCAPAEMWTLTDAQALQLPGRQHIYGTAQGLRATQPETVPATYTDHDYQRVETRHLPPRVP